jgi:hypothetical protein
MWKSGLRPAIPRKGIHKWDFRCSVDCAVQRYTGYTRKSKRVGVCLGWPKASLFMSDRLERKRQNAGDAGYHWLCTSGRIEPN